MEKKTYKTPQTEIVEIATPRMIMVSDPQYTGQGGSGNADARIRFTSEFVSDTPEPSSEW